MCSNHQTLQNEGLGNKKFSEEKLKATASYTNLKDYKIKLADRTLEKEIVKVDSKDGLTSSANKHTSPDKNSLPISVHAATTEGDGLLQHQFSINIQQTASLSARQRVDDYMQSLQQIPESSSKFDAYGAS